MYGAVLLFPCCRALFSKLPDRFLQSVVIIFIPFADIQKLLIRSPVFEIDSSVVICVVRMPTLCTAECFAISACCIDMAADRTCLAGIIRLYLNKCFAMPVQLVHQLLLQLAPRKGRKHPIDLTALVKLTDIETLDNRHRILINVLNIFTNAIRNFMTQPLIITAFFAVRSIGSTNHVLQKIYLLKQFGSYICRNRWMRMQIMKNLRFLVP